jgi:hypothetical protein
VILDVQREGVPISGSVSVSRGARRQFHGWLELAAAVEAARSGSLTADPITPTVDMLTADPAVEVALPEPDPPLVKPDPPLVKPDPPLVEPDPPLVEPRT